MMGRERSGARKSGRAGDRSKAGQRYWILRDERVLRPGLLVKLAFAHASCPNLSDPACENTFLLLRFM
jgi:hypothetical protein